MANCRPTDRMQRLPQQPCAPKCDMVVAMAYVPWQEWNNIYEPEKALQIGTIFPELNKPFTGKRGVC